DRRTGLPGSGQFRGVQRYRLVLPDRLRRDRPRTGGGPIADGASGPGAHADPGDPLRAGLALPGGAGATLVHGPAPSWRSGGAVALPGRGTRAEPVGPASAPRAALRAHPHLVAHPSAGRGVTIRP